MTRSKVDFNTFEDASELLDVLETLREDTTTDDEPEYPVILVEDEQGNTLNTAHLYEEKLTDGSTVYSIVLSKGTKVS